MTATQSFADGITLYLATKLTPSGTLTVTTDPGITTGRLYLKNDNQVEWIDFTSVTSTGIYFTLGGLTRDINPVTIPMTSNSTGKTWLATQPCVLVEMHDQMWDAQQGGPFASFTTAQLNARTNKLVGETFYNTTLGSLVYWNGTSYQSFGTGTFVNATSSSVGGVELATQTEVDAGTDTGSVGPLVVIPSTLDVKVFKQTSLVNSGITGEVKIWTTSTAPTNWLICDGTAVSRTTYAKLFTVIGTTYGVGDNSTTFNIPDFRGRSPLGSGTGTANGATAHALGTTPITGAGGEEKHALIEAELAAHTHTIGTGYTGASVSTSVTGQQYTNTGSSTTGSTGSGTAHNIMSPYTTINFIIRI